MLRSSQKALLRGRKKEAPPVCYKSSPIRSIRKGIEETQRGLEKASGLLHGVLSAYVGAGRCDLRAIKKTDTEKSFCHFAWTRRAFRGVLAFGRRKNGGRGRKGIQIFERSFVQRVVVARRRRHAPPRSDFANIMQIVAFPAQLDRRFPSHAD